MVQSVILTALFLGTVKRHINNLFSKLGVQSRTQAVRAARDLQLF